jgi:SEC-C motif-containing protein
MHHPMQCPCNPDKEYQSCCAPYIEGKESPETAEALMRSRYTAFVMADINYLLNSHHPSTRPTKQRKEILKWTKSLRWIKLDILHTEEGNETAQEGKVEFKAFHEENGRIACIHEKSFFVKVQNKWFYHSGDHLS